MPTTNMLAPHNSHEQGQQQKRWKNKTIGVWALGSTQVTSKGHNNEKALVEAKKTSPLKRRYTESTKETTQRKKRTKLSSAENAAPSTPSEYVTKSKSTHAPHTNTAVRKKKTQTSHVTTSITRNRSVVNDGGNNAIPKPKSSRTRPYDAQLYHSKRERISDETEPSRKSLKSGFQRSPLAARGLNSRSIKSRESFMAALQSGSIEQQDSKDKQQRDGKPIVKKARPIGSGSTTSKLDGQVACVPCGRAICSSEGLLRHLQNSTKCPGSRSYLGTGSSDIVAQRGTGMESVSNVQDTPPITHKESRAKKMHQEPVNGVDAIQEDGTANDTTDERVIAKHPSNPSPRKQKAITLLQIETKGDPVLGNLLAEEARKDKGCAKASPSKQRHPKVSPYFQRVTGELSSETAHENGLPSTPMKKPLRPGRVIPESPAHVSSNGSQTATFHYNSQSPSIKSEASSAAGLASSLMAIPPDPAFLFRERSPEITVYHLDAVQNEVDNTTGDESVAAHVPVFEPFQIDTTDSGYYGDASADSDGSKNGSLSSPKASSDDAADSQLLLRNSSINASLPDHKLEVEPYSEKSTCKKVRFEREDMNLLSQKPENQFNHTVDLPPFSPSPSKPKTSPRKTTAKISPYFSTPTSPKKARLKAGTPVVPPAPLVSPRFGLFQEVVAHEPWKLIIGCIFVTMTRASIALPEFWSFLERYPTPDAVAAAYRADIVRIFAKLGLQEKRTTDIINLSREWITNPPVKGKRYRTENYPVRSAHRCIRRDEGPLADDAEDPREAAFEIAHLPSVGKYILDSFRIFSRDLFRGIDPVSTTIAPEWTRVHPEDKELREYIRWMWLKEGYAWNAVTGEREPASEEMQREAINRPRAVVGETEWLGAYWKVADEEEAKRQEALRREEGWVKKIVEEGM